MILALVRHAESVENADKHNGFYQDRRPYDGHAAHEISRNIVGLTPHGFRQALWVREALQDLVITGARVYTSTYRRAIDTAGVAFRDLPSDRLARTRLLDEQHYGDATYMTKAELFATYPETRQNRQVDKHLWVPPGGGESLADGVWRRAADFVTTAQADLQAGHPVIAVTHHTTILALRARLELRQLTDLVAEARDAKTPTAGIFRYVFRAGAFTANGSAKPPGC